MTQKLLSPRFSARSIKAFLIGVFLLAAGLPGLFAQESVEGGDTYLKHKNAVFLVNQAVYLDAEKIGNRELFKKLEEALGKKVLNQYIPVASGTAFLINGNGSLVTAENVGEFLMIQSALNDARRAASAAPGQGVLRS